jgi:hypothetical protein
MYVLVLCGAVPPVGATHSALRHSDAHGGGALGSAAARESGRDQPRRLGLAHKPGRLTARRLRRHNRCTHEYVVSRSMPQDSPETLLLDILLKTRFRSGA